MVASSHKHAAYRGADDNGLGLDDDVVSPAAPVSVSAAAEAPEELHGWVGEKDRALNSPTHHGKDKEEEDDARNDTAKRTSAVAMHHVCYLTWRELQRTWQRRTSR